MAQEMIASLRSVGTLAVDTWVPLVSELMNSVEMALQVSACSKDMVAMADSATAFPGRNNLTANFDKYVGSTDLLSPTAKF